MPTEIETSETAATDFQLKYKVQEIEEERRLVFGWASVVVTADGQEVVDHHGHIIDPLELEDAVYIFVRYGGMAGEMHANMYIGSIVESMVFTPEKCKALGIPEGTLPTGWWIGLYIHSDDVWEKIKDGTYEMFSIGGRAIKTPVDD